MTPSPRDPEDEANLDTSPRRQTNRRRWTLLVLVLIIIAVALALGHYGVTPITTFAALTTAIAALFSGRRAPTDREPATAAAVGPARRALLTSAALSTAAVVGETARRRARPRPASDDDGVSLTDFSDLAIDRGDSADPTTWDWTPALREAVRVAANEARVSRRLTGSSAYRRTGLPPIRIPAGSYRITGSVPLEYLHGLIIAGDGRQASVLVHEGDGALFDVHRSSLITFTGLSIIGRDPAVAAGADVRGLREGSCAVRFEETTTDDNEDGGNTYVCTFNSVEVNEMHRAFAFAGDQMTDGIIWNDLRMRDNFIDFDYANGQAVNHQLFGGEVLYGVSYPEESYAQRLRTWAEPPDLRDGAVLNISTGGDVTFFGGSIIVRKPTLTFAPPVQVDSTDVVSNTLGYNFFATRWEFRERDVGGDQAGLQRCTLVRWLVPVPKNRDVQPTLRFDACRFIMVADDVDLLYIANASAISWDGCRAFPPKSARVVTLVSPETARLPGAFLSEGSSVLPVTRRLMANTDDGVDHIIEVTARGAPDIGQGSSPAGYSTVVAGVPSTARRVIHRQPGGYLLTQGQRRHEVQLRVPPGALVKEVGAVLSAETSEPVSVIVNNDTQAIARLSPGPAERVLVQSVEQFVASGFLTVTASRPGVGAVSGYVYVEYF